MRTTLDLEDTLIREAKAYAAREGKSLTRIIEEALAARLREENIEHATAQTQSLPVWHGKGGLRSGVVNPASHKHLLDLIDDTEQAL